MLIRKPVSILVLATLLLLTLTLFPWSNPLPALAQGPEAQSQPKDLVYNEQQTVYLGNLKRAAHNRPPLRWNRQLTEAARWFSWDSVENRPGGYCGHGDTNNEGPLERIRKFGYYGFGGAENAFCGYVTPDFAVEGWYNETPPNDGHRQNLLNSWSWEVGLGYYRRDSDGRGYVTQDFGQDSAYPPVVINNEAVQTSNPAVTLYIYSHSSSSDDITGLGPAVEMMVANDRCSFDDTWEPYSPTRSWTLEPGTDWRTIYVKTRDASGRSTVVEDTIYLGSSIPYQDLSLEQASTRSGRSSCTSWIAAASLLCSSAWVGCWRWKSAHCGGATVRWSTILMPRRDRHIGWTLVTEMPLCGLWPAATPINPAIRLTFA